MTPATHIDRTIDATGQMCPMPILTLARVIKELPANAVIEITATDAGAKKDIPAWCEKTGNTLLDSKEDGRVLTFYVRKTA